MQINTGQVLIYGGVTSIRLNGTKHIFDYSNEAYLWSNESWSLIPIENPCPINGQNLVYRQPCTSRTKANEIEVIIVTFAQKQPCTSILNLNSLNWTIILSKDVNIPIGGHMVTSLDKARVFYLGGLNNEHPIAQSLDVFELGMNGWELTKAKLPFGIASHNTISYPSLHNVTLT